MNESTTDNPRLLGVEVDDINLLHPVKGEKVVVDLFGNGVMRDFKLTRVTRNTFHGKRFEYDGSTVSFKCNFRRTPFAHAFWRDETTGVLHYQGRKSHGGESRQGQQQGQ